MNERTHSNTFTGWREWVRMPEIEVPWIKAKIDTGAQSSAVHAYDIEELERDGQEWVRFSIHPWQHSNADPHRVELPIFDRRVVKSSSGHTEDRVVVLITLKLVGRWIKAEVTLTNRDVMGFRMLIGREALRNGYVVDSSASYLGGKPPRAIRRKNRGLASSTAVSEPTH